MAISEKYTLPIGEVDRQARLFRECEAMLGVLSGRGGQVSPQILDLISVLDAGLDNSDRIPLRDLLALHSAMAQAIRPELPQAAELLQWEAVRPKHWIADGFRFLAPVSAIRKVMLFTIISFAAFFYIVIFGTLTADSVIRGIPLFDASPTAAIVPQGTLIGLTVFFTSLSAIGACFATLYDASRHVTEGTYDPRHGSSYAIRIGLGMMAGFLLSQVLTTQAGDWAIFGRTVLALLGGFSGQLVYNVLSKLVRAVEGLFEEDPRQMRTRMKSEADAREQVEKMRQQAQQAAEATAFAARMEAVADPELRTELTRDFVAQATGTTSASARREAADDPIDAGVSNATDVAGFLEQVLEILPAEKGARVRAELDRVRSALARIRVLKDRGGLIAEAAKLGALSLADGPLKDVLAGTVGKLAIPLRVLGVSPLGLALVVATLAARSGPKAFRRWKARVLAAPHLADLLDVDPIDAAAVKAALDRLPEAAAVLALAADDTTTLVAVGQAAADMDADSFFARFGRGAFDGTAQAFEAAVAPFREAMRDLRKAELDRQVAAEIPDDILALSGAPDRPRLLAALDALQHSSEALAELEKLFLLAASTRDKPNGLAILKALTGLLRAQEPQAAPT